jgi:hypothetical protein
VFEKGTGAPERGAGQLHQIEEGEDGGTRNTLGRNEKHIKNGNRKF